MKTNKYTNMAIGAFMTATSFTAAPLALSMAFTLITPTQAMAEDRAFASKIAAAAKKGWKKSSKKYKLTAAIR